MEAGRNSPTLGRSPTPGRSGGGAKISSGVEERQIDGMAWATPQQTAWWDSLTRGSDPKCTDGMREGAPARARGRESGSAAQEGHVVARRTCNCSGAGAGSAAPAPATTGGVCAESETPGAEQYQSFPAPDSPAMEATRRAWLSQGIAEGIERG